MRTGDDVTRDYILTLAARSPRTSEALRKWSMKKADNGLPVAADPPAR